MPTNFLVFIVDQLNARHLGCMGNSAIATPHIDGLAARGWMATDCHVASPICMPNRASLMTGRMPSLHGVRHNGIPLSLGSRTFVQALREAGYQTALCGKSHLQNITSKRPVAHSSRREYGEDAQVRFPGKYMQECVSTWREQPMFEVDLPYYGFSSVDLAIEHGDCPEGHYLRWLRQEHPEALDLAGQKNAIPTPNYRLAQLGQAWRTRLPEALHPTAWTADRAVEQIQRACRQNQRFFVYCSFADPHHPYTPPGKYWDMYDPSAVELPASFVASEGPPHWHWLQNENANGTAIKSSPACFAATEREAREAIALNWGALSFIDAQIGRVLRALEVTGCADDTVVIFTSDHGEFAGDHALLLKGSLHYDSLTRTPLIWRGPGEKHGGICSDAMLSTIDIGLSILERAGVEPFNGMQGRSFLPLIQSRPEAYVRRNRMLIEEDGQRIYYGFERPVRMRTLLTPDHRLSVYEGESWGELYARKQDADEVHNLWAEHGSRALRDRLLGELAYELMQACDTSPKPTAFA